MIGWLLCFSYGSKFAIGNISGTFASVTGSYRYISNIENPVHWQTKKQTHVALSTEAEFVAMSLACRELANVREMCVRLIRTKFIPIVHEDNKAAIELAQTEESKTLKHLVNLCYHYVGFEARCNAIKIKWICSDEQIGDFFTKALANPKFSYFRNNLTLDCMNKIFFRN